MSFWTLPRKGDELANNNERCQITLLMPPETLRFEGGDVVLRLSNNRSDTLVVHSGVLSAASDSFHARMNGGWGTTADAEAVDPSSGETVSVYKYKMLFDEGGFVLTDEVCDNSGIDLYRKLISIQKDTISTPVPDRTKPFNLTPLAQGYPSRKGKHRHVEYDHEYDTQDIRRITIEDHKLLFGLNYRRDIHLTEETIPEAILRIINIMALAEYYESLPSIAEQIEDIVLDLPGIWKAIADFPVLYLAVGKKLRSTKIFADALRHFVGKGMDLEAATEEDVLIKAEACLAILPPRQCLEKRTSELLEQIRRSTLTVYQPREYLSKRKQPPAELTTWLLAGFDNRSTEEKCKFLAASAFRDWFDQQLAGDNHWSHIKYSLTSPKDGDVQAGSLRVACETILKAAEDTSAVNLEYVGQRIVNRYTRIFHLDQEKRKAGQYHPAATITHELRRLVRHARSVIIPFFTDQKDESWHRYYWHKPCCDLVGRGERHEKAKYDKVKYFTCMSVEEGGMPWSGLRELVIGDLPEMDLRAASVAWLRAVSA